MNPMPNNPNPEFNPSNFQPPPNFKPGFAPYSQGGFQQSISQPRFESNFVSPNQPDNEVVPETQDTQKRNKNVRKTNSRSEQDRVVVTWHRNNGLTMKKPLSENATWTNLRTKLKKLTVTWNNMMGFDVEYCTYHQLNSKWKDMCTKLRKFCGIYNNCANNRKSGMSDENKVTMSEVLRKEPKTPNRTSIRRGVRPPIQITRLTSRMTSKKPSLTLPGTG
ncbi:hypothetical protein R6Q57_004653 [Mikania cordata]